MMIRHLITICLIPLTLHAGDAVSRLNGKLGFNYGDYDSDEGHTVNGSLALPVTKNFGAQIDGLYTHVANQDFYGIGGHFFWRDWDKALIGLGAAGVYSKNVHTYEAGLEAEYYFKWMTLGFYTGYAGIKYDNNSPFIDTDRIDPFGTVYIGIYPIPDLVIRPAFTRKLGNNLVSVEAEYEIPRINLSVTAESTWGEHDFRQTQFGLRYYFGSKKSLKRRHREDDPVNLVSGSLTSIGTYGAEHISNIKAFIRENPGLFVSAPPNTTGTTTGTIVTIPSAGSDTPSPTITESPSTAYSGAGAIQSNLFLVGGLFSGSTRYSDEIIQQAIAQGGTITLPNGTTLHVNPTMVQAHMPITVIAPSQ